MSLNRINNNANGRFIEIASSIILNLVGADSQPEI
jgi:hypothetical protein